jgi:WD40 repeat protein
VAFDKTGQHVVTGSYDGTARVWEVASGKQIMVLEGHTGGVRAVAFSPDGDYILTVGQRVTSLTANGNTIPLPTGMLTDDAAPPDNTVRVWDAESGKPLTVITELTSEINLAVFSADSKMIATATNDGTVRVRTATTGEDITKFSGGHSNLNSIAFSPDGKFVLTAGNDQTAQIWKVANSTSVAQPVGLGTRTYRYVRFDATGENIVTASTDSNVRFRKVTGESKPVVRRLLPFGTTVYDITLSPNNKFAVTASIVPRRLAIGETAKATDSGAHVWNMETNKPIKDLNPPVSVEPVAPAKGAPTENPPPPESAPPVKKVVYSPKGSYLLTVSSDGAVRVWKTSDWTILREWKSTEDKKSPGIWAFDPGEKYLLHVARTGDISLWEISSGIVKPLVKTLDEGIKWVAFNDAGDLIVTASSDSTARVWTSEGKAISTLSGHRGDVLSAEFSPDGNFIVTSGADSTVRVWDVETEGPVSVFKIHEDVAAVRASFSPDGKSIVVGDAGAYLYVFDCEMCRPFDEIKNLADALKPRPLTVGERSRFLPGISVLPNP